MIDRFWNFSFIYKKKEMSWHTVSMALATLKTVIMAFYYLETRQHILRVGQWDKSEKGDSRMQGGLLSKHS